MRNTLHLKREQSIVLLSLYEELKGIKANTSPVPDKTEQEYENDYDDHSRGH